MTFDCMIAKNRTCRLSQVRLFSLNIYSLSVELVIIPAECGYRINKIQNSLYILLKREGIDVWQILERQVICLHHFLKAHSQPTYVVLSLIEWKHLPVDTGKTISCHHSGTDAGLNREDHISIQFHILTDESVVFTALWDDPWAVSTAVSRHELAGNIGHHSKRNIAVSNQFIIAVQHVEMIEKFFKNLFTGALRHRLFDIIAIVFTPQTIEPQCILVVRLACKVLVIKHEGNIPS